jgi:hypothetical protein
VPLDEKPKATDDPRDLARVRDILVGRASRCSSTAGPRTGRSWAGCGSVARLAHRAVRRSRRARHGRSPTLRAKYPQYVSHRLEERPLIRIDVTGASSWGTLAG